MNTGHSALALIPLTPLQDTLNDSPQPRIRCAAWKNDLNSSILASGQRRGAVSEQGKLLNRVELEIRVEKGESYAKPRRMDCEHISRFRMYEDGSG